MKKWVLKWVQKQQNRIAPYTYYYKVEIINTVKIILLLFSRNIINLNLEKRINGK
jgi:hypothetical protein